MSAANKVYLVYDKECPACNMYCTMARIRADVGELVLVDARQDGPVMDAITKAGLDIDHGMVVMVGETIYYGSDAVNVLALMSTNRGFFNRLSYQCFRSKRVSHFLYPFLRACRNLLLKLLGKTKINNLGLAGNDRF